MKTITGTCHFVSLDAARRYYRPYAARNVGHYVGRKIREGEIVIGKPELKAGERLVLLDGGKRYGVESGGER